jgi:hypothetical protein
MTQLLQKAFEEASQLPAEEQDSLGRWLLDELNSEHVWAEAFRRSASQLEQLSDEALEEHRRGRTRDLDPDKL